MFKQKGFTLVEIILVIAIFTLIAGLTYPYMWTYLARQQLAVTTEDIITSLKRAQNKAITNEENTAWGIFFYDDYYLIIKYPSESESENFSLPNNLSVTGDMVIFQKLTGKPEDSATLTIRHSGINEQKIISINEEGNIQIQ